LEMNRISRRFALACLAFTFMGTTSSLVLAQTWPVKPVHIVVPFTSGGSTDIVARIIAAKLTTSLGQPVIVDNRAGAGGTLGSDFVAKSPADGYTLLMGTSSTMAIAPNIYNKLPYNTLNDLMPVSLLGTADVVLVANAGLPFKTFNEFMSYAKANPGKLTYASGGNGSISHLLGEYFKSMASVNLLHIPYKGDAQMVIDLVGGQVDIAFGTAVAFLPQIKAGRVTPLAVTNPKRSTSMTTLPTISESGVTGYQALQWFGIAAPAGTPKAVVDRLNASITTILAMPDVRNRFTELGFDIVGGKPEDFGAYLRAENESWKKIANIAGAKLD
jgi:tripartite-type tricarboxylate transporter receptor subunit TctC